MGIEISINDQTFNIHLNNNICYIELENEGYFLNKRLNKVVIMNPTAYCLWKYLKKLSLNFKVQKIKETDIIDYLKTIFTFTKEDLLNLIDDLIEIIKNFINEGILIKE